MEWRSQHIPFRKGAFHDIPSARMTEDMQVRNLALNTQASYLQQVSLFARHFDKSPEQLGPEDIRAYQVFLTNEKHLAPGSVLIAVAACDSSTRSPSKRTGPSQTSFRRQRNLRNCLWF
jgi:hypothetical protein